MPELEPLECLQLFHARVVEVERRKARSSAADSVISIWSFPGMMTHLENLTPATHITFFRIRYYFNAAEFTPDFRLRLLF
ncbi:hypothetical protein KR51_00001040 [Rubidibacter lacunae KORDI 51-2]|uniref:Uncharacterized protein n=1 Tax=Rubidibacter lacunae KORDI 51-2 TaxID=582515 RepID=U5DQU7_9CHRO|nr:hypothetical protein KR51_00001040 [Rubidibacter lacunae KORDI 51-2]